MTTRKDIFIEGEYYHIYNRGNSKQDIFIDDQDRNRFVKLLYLCNSVRNIEFTRDVVDKKIEAFDFDRGDSIISIGAWALMPNHFHLYITPSRVERRGPLRDEKNPISLFMNKLSTGYSMYFNKKNKRTGKLFEGAFKSVLVKNDEHAKYNFSYIHLNPVKLIDPIWKEKGIKDIQKTLNFLSKYRWSSYNDYRGIKRPESKIICPKDFHVYFSDNKVSDEEIFEWLNYKEV